MATVILRPTGAGSGVYTGTPWSRSGGSNNYEMVDESSADGDSTYNSSSTTGAADLFSFEDLPDGFEPTSVTVYIRSRLTGAYGVIYHYVKSGATEGLPGVAVPTSSYADYASNVLSTDPDGDVAWTAEAVNALLAGYYNVVASGGANRVTQVWLSVEGDYSFEGEGEADLQPLEAAATGSQSADAAGDADLQALDASASGLYGSEAIAHPSLAALTAAASATSALEGLGLAAFQALVAEASAEYVVESVDSSSRRPPRRLLSEPISVLALRPRPPVRQFGNQIGVMKL